MKSWRRWPFLTSGGLVIFLLAAIPVLAAEAEENPAETPVGMMFRWLNFAIIFGGITYLIAKHGGAFFRGNAKAIAASIHAATAEKALADRELSEVNAKISRLGQEVEELRQAARQGAATEAERLRVSGQAEIEKIKLAARAELGASERAAQHQLREAAASMAVERAGTLIHSRMNPQVRGKLFQSFLGELGRSSN